MPSDGERPIMHVTDIKFDNCFGKNILCFSPTVDLRRNFNATFSKPVLIKGFMSVRRNTWLKDQCYIIYIFM
jgi:hypothetical protein